MSIARHFTSFLVKQSAVVAELRSATTLAGARRLPRVASVLMGGQNVHDGKRSLHTTGIKCESALAKLRKKTGYAFSLCRKALELHEQDIAKAEKWLRAEAIKQGWAKAERVKSRATGEGLIGIYTTPDKSSAAMVEVKCETDFVAKNDNFIELVTKLAEKLSKQSAAIHQAADSRDSGHSINKLWIVDEAKLTEIAGDAITEAIGKLGENIRLVRGCIIRVQAGSGESTLLLPYTHAVAGKITSKAPNVILGKYGTIIAIQKRPATEEALDVPTDAEIIADLDEVGAKSIDEVGFKLGQHIIGLSPLTVVPVKTESGEVPENAVGDEEPTALIKQKFIFNDEITVEQFLAKSNAQVLDFVRFECGEEAESD